MIPTHKGAVISPEQQEMRFRVLSLVLRNVSDTHQITPVGEVVEIAERLYGFVTGVPSQTPREVIAAALDKAGVA